MFNTRSTRQFFTIKHIICLIFVLLCVNTSIGQNISFMGIPLGIPLDSFKQQLLAKGFTYDSERSDNTEYYDTFLFDGRFAGEVVGVSVFVSPKSHIVYSVAVQFNGYAWSIYGTGVSENTQNGKFDDIKASLCKKYPSVIPYEWQNDEFPRNVCWKSEKWSISLCISKYGSAWKNLGLTYTDEEAVAKAIAEKESDY